MSGPCSTSETRRVNLVTNRVISHERGKDREVFAGNMRNMSIKLYIMLFVFIYLRMLISNTISMSDAVRLV